MAVCPRCGKEMQPGTTRCWSKECDAARFRIADWHVLTDRAVAVNYLLRRKNIPVDLFTVLPPVPEDQITEFQEKTGLKLPEDFQHFFRRMAGGWRFHWDLYSLEKNGYLGPEKLVGSQGGNGEVPFIGVTSDRPLLTVYNEFQEEIRYSEIAEETEAILPSLFPLHTREEGGTDFTVLRMDTVPEQVVYLAHEFNYSVSTENIIAHGFGDFLRKWSGMGFPSCQFLRNGKLNDETEQVKQWWQWLEERLDS